MIIYGAILSPFVRKVLMFAAEKGVAVELKPGGFGQGGEEFADASPFGKMPALRDPGAGFHGDYTLCDSSAICTYIEGKHPDAPLFPADPRARAEAVWLDEFADTILMAAGGAMFFNRIVSPVFMKKPGDLAAADLAETVTMPRILDWLNDRLEGRDFLVGEALTLADIAVVQPFFNTRRGGFVVDAARWPDVARWVAAMEARPSLAAMLAKAEASLDKVLAAAG